MHGGQAFLQGKPENVFFPFRGIFFRAAWLPAPQGWQLREVRGCRHFSKKAWENCLITPK